MTHRSPSRLRGLLLASVSALALLGTAAPLAQAQSPVFARRSAAVADPAAAAARSMQAQALEAARAAQYAESSLQVFARAAQTRAAMANLQAAARAAAQAAPDPGVPNGLVAGGLVPRLDPAQWRGAVAPVQGASPLGPGRTEVTVRQTEQRAILTWDSFNVGRETDLRFDQSAGGTRAREWSVLNRIEDPSGQPSRILGSIRAEGQVYVINRNGVIFGGASQVNVSTLIASALDIGDWTDTVAQRDQRFLAGFLPRPAGTGNGNYTPNLSLDRLETLREGGTADGAPRRIAVEVLPGAQITIAEEGSAILAAPQVLNAGAITAPSGQVIMAAGAGLRLDPPREVNGVAQPFSAPIGLEAESLRGPPKPTSGPNRGEDIFGVDTFVFETRNEGIVSAPRGNVTLTGYSVVNAPGAVLSATTANNRAGSVVLTARDYGGPEIFDPQPALTGATFDPIASREYRFGPLLLGRGNLIEIGPESGDDQVLFNGGATDFAQSQLALTGGVVRMEPDSILRAPAAAMRISGDFPARVFTGDVTPAMAGRLQAFVMEAGSVIDLGGLKGLEAPITRNFVEVATFRNELADAPLQRNGFLFQNAQQRGLVTIDTRIGSEIVAWQATANNTPIPLAERLAPGGRLEVAAERSFLLAGSVIDVSGGTLTYQGGLRPSTTRLLSASGRIYDIGTAPADQVYVGLPGLLTRSQERWGVEENFASPLLATRPVFEAGYTEGFDAGSVTFVGRFYGDGVVQGGAFVGDRQLAATRTGATTNDGDEFTSTDVPHGGTLSFDGFGRVVRVVGNVDQTITRTSGISGLVNPVFVPVTDALPTDFASRLVPAEPVRNQLDFRYALEGDPIPAGRFDSQLSLRDVVNRGWSTVRVAGDGRVTLPEGAEISLPPGGQIAINAWSVDLGGRILIPGGRITVQANAGDRVAPPGSTDSAPPVEVDGMALPPGAETLAGAPIVYELPFGLPTSDLAGAILVGPQAVLSTRGRWVNDFAGRLAGDPRGGTAFLDGGGITLETRYAQVPRLASVPLSVPPPGVDSAAIAVFGHPLIIRSGALLDVSGGGALSASRALTGGSGGTLAVKTYADLAASPTGVPRREGGSTSIPDPLDPTRTINVDVLTVFPVIKDPAQTASNPSGGNGTGAGAFIAGNFTNPLIETGARLIGFGTGRIGGTSANGAGGTLRLAAASVVLGRAATAEDAAVGRFVVESLDPFAQAGFGRFDLTAQIAGGPPFRAWESGNLEVAAGAVVAPVAASQIVDPPAAARVPSGSPPDAWTASRGVLSRQDRAATEITLRANNRLSLGDGDAAIRISADPGGPGRGSTAAITLLTAQPLLLGATLEAPAGAIAVTGRGSLATTDLSAPYRIEGEAEIQREVVGTDFQLSDALWVGATARLLAPGVADSLPAARGLTAGAVRPGGTVTLTETRSYLVLEAGSLIDVSGVAGVTGQIGTGLQPLDRRAGQVPLAGPAGAITLQGARGLFPDGDLRGAPGGPGAAGGLLTIWGPSPYVVPGGTIVSAPNGLSVPTALPGPIGVVLRRPGATLPPGVAFGDPIDPTLERTGRVTWTGGRFTDRAFLASDRLAGSGIDRVHLIDTNQVMVEDGAGFAVPRALQISAPALRLIPRIPDPGTEAAGAATPAASVQAAYLVLLGGAGTAVPSLPSGAAPPSGALTLAAGQIDVFGAVQVLGAERTLLDSAGDLRLIGIGIQTVAATAADFDPLGRARGALVSQGDLTLRAAQVYPATGSDFTLRAADAVGQPGRTLRIEGQGGAVPTAPLAAGSILTLRADRIEQAGVLRSPQGEIRFRGPTDAIPASSVALLAGSLTSVSADGRVVPYGQTASDANPFGVEFFPSLVNPSTTARSGGLAGPPEKAIELGTVDAPATAISIAPGALIDASGGGDLLAFRFIAGPGGSRDVLARADYGLTFPTPAGTTPTYQFADRRDVFAILPGAQPTASPYSAYLRDSGSSLGRGDVTVEGPLARATDSFGRSIAGVNIYGQQTVGLLPTVGDQITLAQGIPGLPSGSYTLLPGRYAILPGAFRVVMPPAPTRPSLAAAPLPAAVPLPDGSYAVQGVRTVTGTALQESVPRLVTIAPAESWSQFSTLVFDRASDFFAARAARLGETAPRLPVDAGRLTLVAREALTIQGATRFAPAPGGRGGQVEITAERLAITPGGAAYDVPGFVSVSDAAISGFGAETVTIGGTRRLDTAGEVDGDRLLISARTVVVAPGASVTAPELVLMAVRPEAADQASPQDGLRVEDGATVAAAGTVVGTPTPLLLGRVEVRDGTIVTVPGLSGDGAVMRVSAAGQTRVVRTSLPATTTPLSVGPLARLSGNAALLDATGGGRIAETAGFQLRALDLVGNAILLGDVPVATAAAGDGFTLGRGVLQGLGGLDQLRLRSGNAIDVYGPVALSAADSLILDAAALRGFAGATFTATAGRTLGLGNSGAPAQVAAAPGTGAFALTAGETLLLGPGGIAVTGFGEARFDTPGTLRAEGTGSLSLPGGLSATAALVTGADGAKFALDAGGAVALSAPAAPLTTLPTGGLGASLAVTGTAISLGTTIALPAGTVQMTATGGDLTLAPEASISVAGAILRFFDVTREAPGGTIALTASRSSVRLGSGAVLDVSSPGALAGEVSLSAQQGSVAWEAAVLRGGAAEPEGVGGRFAIDTGGAIDLSALNTRLDEAGFFAARHAHSRDGDLLLPAGATMRAHEVTLTADGGAVTIAGRIDSSGQRGGQIGLWGRDGVALLPGSVLDARAADPGRAGGTVEIGTSAGPLLLRDGATILVGGGDPLRGRLVRLRLPVDDFAASDFGVAVADARRVEVEPFRVATDGVVSQARIAALFEETRALDLRADPRLAGKPETWRVTPGVEITGAASLALAAGNTIALQDLRAAGDDPGVLTLRAPGDLTLESTITDGFRPITEDIFRAERLILPGDRLSRPEQAELAALQADPLQWRLAPITRPVTEAEFRAAEGIMPSASLTPSQQSLLLQQRRDTALWVPDPALTAAPRSWSYRLVAGADAGSANPLATVQGAAGSVLIGRPWAYDGSATGNPTVFPVTVRTGTGSIAVAASRDVLLRDPTATIYTAGRQRPDPDQVAGLREDGSQGTGAFILPIPPEGNRDAPSTELLVGPGTVAYPIEGGDLSVRSGRDIRATVFDPLGGNAGQTPQSWLQWKAETDPDTGLFTFLPIIDVRWSTTPEGNRSGRENEDAVLSGQSSWWIDLTRFRQGFATMGGGDATVLAGRDFEGSVSIPTTGRTGGGLPASFVYYVGTQSPNAPPQIAAPPVGGANPAVLSVDGGGDLVLRALGDILPGSQFLVGRGEGEVRAGGAVASRTARAFSTRTSVPNVSPFSTAEVGGVFAVGDARLRVTAGGSVTASVYDPALEGRLGLPYANSSTTSFILPEDMEFAIAGLFPTTTAETQVTLTSLGAGLRLLGSVTAPGQGAQDRIYAPLSLLGVAPRARQGSGILGLRYTGALRTQFDANASRGFGQLGVPRDTDAVIVRLPPTIEIAAFTGDIGVPTAGNPVNGRTFELQPAPLPTGGITILAGGSITQPRIGMPDTNTDFLFSPYRPFQTSLTSGPSIDFRPTAPLRPDNPTRSLIYALEGDIVRPVFDVATRIGLRAGRDITDVDAVIRHANPGDISFIRAGRDIGTRPDPAVRPYGPDQNGVFVGVPLGNTVEVQGPGRLQIIAGRDIAPIRRATNVAFPAVGAQPADEGIRSIGNAANLLLPEGGASIDLLFAVGPEEGFDTTGFLDRYLAPGAPGGYRVALAPQPNGGAIWAIEPDAAAPTDPATRDAIRALPEPERLALAVDLFFREIAASGQAAALDPSAASYARGFDAIGALFPFPTTAGNLNLQNTYVRTEQGGDINVLGPGGTFLLGAITGDADQFPDRVGTLTLNYGSINLFAEGDIQAGQSRIITVDGGDILAWSSTADINAGLGSRTTRFIPPFRVDYLTDGLRIADRAGLVTGSGIATLTPFTDPATARSFVAPDGPEAFGEPGSPGSVTIAAAQAEETRRRTAPSIVLVAPFGAVDFGDAGVRSAGNLNVAAQVVLNASNVQVAGAQTGVPTVQAPNVAGAVAASATAGQAAGAASDVARQAARGSEAQPQDQPSVITVQILAVGGDEGDAAALGRR